MSDYRRSLMAWAPYVAPALLLGAFWLALQASSEVTPWPQISPSPAVALGSAAPAVPRQVVELQTYSAVWELPLFSEGRRADPQHDPDAGNPPPAVDDLVLTGVIVAPPLRVALLRQGGSQALSLREGEQLPSGWALTHVDEQKVELTYGDHRHTLEISSPRLPMPIQ